jgi:DNA topoisomerase-1
MENLGVEKVGVAVEWSVSGLGETALGNPSPCPVCAPLEGIVMRLSEAHGLIPRHPNCMCTFVPANVGEDSEDQIDTQSGIERAIRDSLEEEGGAEKSSWAGTEVEVDKARPQSIFNVEPPEFDEHFYKLYGDDSLNQPLAAFSEAMAALNAGGNCGIGPDGFEEGNTCAKGGSDAKIGVDKAKLRSIVPQLGERDEVFGLKHDEVAIDDPTELPWSGNIPVPADWRSLTSDPGKLDVVRGRKASDIRASEDSSRSAIDAMKEFISDPENDLPPIVVERDDGGFHVLDGNTRFLAAKELGYKKIPVREHLVANVFCATGEGGGVDPTCSPRETTTGAGEKLHGAIRVGEGKAVHWETLDGKPLPEHIRKLAIPPAWKDAYFNPDPKGNLLAKGTDAKGRTQMKYGDTHNARAAAAKFGRVSELRAKREQIFKEVDHDSKNLELKENADALKVVMQTGIRPGSTQDTGADFKSFGATTLEGRHVVVKGGEVKLKFVTGKNKGRAVEFPISDPKTAAMLQERAMSVGAKGKLFDTDAGSLRDYSKSKDGGGFKTKDHRTALGTETAIREINKVSATPKTMKEYKVAVKEVATVVAKTLGNTPSVALKSYIDPTVFAKWKPKE